MPRPASEHLDLRGLTVQVDSIELDGVDLSATDFSDVGSLITDLTSTAAELNYLDLTTLGTGAVSKAVVLDASGTTPFLQLPQLLCPLVVTLPWRLVLLLT